MTKPSSSKVDLVEKGCSIFFYVRPPRFTFKKLACLMRKTASQWGQNYLVFMNSHSKFHYIKSKYESFTASIPKTFCFGQKQSDFFKYGKN